LSLLNQKSGPPLQMKGRCESNINVRFSFMYSQKWNCYFHNRIIMFCLPVQYISERFICFQDRSAYSATGKYVDRSWEYINRSQTHEYRNWDWGRAIPRKGIHKCKCDFSCSVETVTLSFFSLKTSSSKCILNRRFDSYLIFLQRKVTSRSQKQLQ
jgi:hypothetical protein